MNTINYFLTVVSTKVKYTASTALITLRSPYGDGGGTNFSVLNYEDDQFNSYYNFRTFKTSNFTQEYQRLAHLYTRVTSNDN